MKRLGNDVRIRILRAMGLDELPQVIFRGEMSFVGPSSLVVGEIVEDAKSRVVPYDFAVLRGSDLSNLLKLCDYFRCLNSI